MHSTLHGLAKTLRLSLNDLERLEEKTARQCDTPNALVSHLKKLHTYEAYAAKSKELTALEESALAEIRKSTKYLLLQQEKDTLIKELKKAEQKVTPAFVKAKHALDVAEHGLKRWKAKANYQKQAGYPQVKENYRQKLADYYKNAVPPSSQKEFLAAETTLITATKAYEKLKSTSNHKSHKDYQAIKENYKNKLKHFNNQLTCLEPFISSNNQRYLELHKHSIEKCEKITTTMKKLESEHLEDVFTHVFIHISELAVSAAFLLSTEYSTQLLAHIAKDKTVLAEKNDNKIKPPIKFYRQLFETPGYDGSSPLQWMKVHASMSDNEDKNSANSSLSVNLLEWMRAQMEEHSEDFSYYTHSLESKLNKKYIEAVKLYEDQPIIDSATKTQTGIKKASEENKKTALRKWFSLVAYHAHYDSLKRLKMHIGTNRHGDLLAKMDVILNNRSQFEALAKQHKIDNLFVLAYKELWGGWGAKDYAQQLMIEIVNIRNPALYALLESMEPEHREWHRAHPHFYRLIEAAKNKVAAAASFKGCPYAIIHTVFHETNSGLNAFHEAYSGLAHAVRNENLPVVEWFLDEKAHIGHMPYTHELLNDAGHPFRQAVTSPSDDNQILRLLAKHYAIPFNVEFSAVLLSSHKECNPQHAKKTRFLKAAHALLPYTWPSNERQDSLKAPEINLDPENENTDSKQTAASTTKTNAKKVSAAKKDWVLFDLSQCLKTLDELKNNNQQDDLRFILNMVQKNLGEAYKDFHQITEQYADVLNASSSSPAKPMLRSSHVLFAPRVTGHRPHPGPEETTPLDHKYTPTSTMVASTKEAP